MKSNNKNTDNIHSKSPPDVLSNRLKDCINSISDFLNTPIFSKLLVCFFITLFIVIFLTNNYLYIKADIGIKGNDNHFYRSVQYYDRLMMRGDADLTHHRFPPLVYLITTCYYAVNGISFETARLSVFIFSIIFLLAMFGIGYEMGGTPGGFSVMALAGASQHILEQSRLYFLDFPQTALTALAFYLLLRSDYFRNRNISLLFGLVTALSMLAKWSTAFYLFIPVLWFLLPNIFRSFRSFKTFLLYLIPASFMLTGTVWFIKQIDPASSSLHRQWFLYYLLFTVLPSIICSAVFLFLNLRWKREENYVTSGASAIINFGFMSSVFAVITSVWFYWAGFSVKGMMPTYAYTDPRDMSQNLATMQTFILSMSNFIPFLMIIGVIFLFIKSRNIARDILVPINLILTSILMLRLMYPAFRVILPLVIFGTTLGGYWTGVLKNHRIAYLLTIVIVAISLISIAVPGENCFNYPYFQLVSDNLDSYNPRKMFLSVPPEENVFNLYPVLRNLTWNDGEGWKNIAVYSSEHFPGDVNDILAEAYTLGKKFNTIYCWQSNRPEMFQQHAANALKGGMQDFENMDDILIVHRIDENPEIASKKILDTFFPVKTVRKKKFILNYKWRITNIKIDRHQPGAGKGNKEEAGNARR